ncbi:PLP-dependent aminotransferase family protein [Nocardioides sp. NPDC047086]|uniref:aminotransferase-like domain-containing protein n=1 Tax=Nocardioides sp. NPDC047086 TaxID=3154810 RepID=UPI0033C9AAF5
MSAIRTDARLPLAARSEQLVGSVIDSSTSLLAEQTHDIVRLAMGSPAQDSIPAAALAEVPLEPHAFDYAATEGDPVLREALLAQLAGTSDATTPDRLTITSGGMQGLDLVHKLFTDPGDLVVIEAPTYTNGTATALSYSADLLEIPVDEEGLDVERLEAEVRRTDRRPKSIYAIPTFQNPSGATLSLERRVRLIELAREWGSILIDDDPYGLLRFAGDPLPTLHELAEGDPLVFSVRTFSKTVAPGLRVGWVDADPSLGQLLINAKQAMDTCTNLPAQRQLAGFLDSGGFDAHVADQRIVYKERKEAMRAALTEHFEDRATWTDPDGGFFLWVTFDPPVYTTALFEVALAEGVALIPGNAFSPGGLFPHAMRLCFASTPPARIAEGIARLRRAVDRFAREAR